VLDGGERRPGSGGHRTSAQHGRGGPAEPPGLHQRRGERAERGDGEHLAAEIHRTQPRLGDRREPRDREQRTGRERQVEQERAAPAPGSDQYAAQDRPAGRGDPGDGAPQSERAGALFRVGERRLEQQQGRGDQHSRADSLGQPRRHQHAQGRRQAARGRRGAEERQARGEQPAPAAPLGERATGEQERGEAQRVGVHDPLQPGDAAVQPPPYGRECHVGHRGVQDDHEVAGADQGQCRRPGAGFLLRPRRCCRLHTASLAHQYFAA
jgi:hypothetical protein